MHQQFGTMHDRYEFHKDHVVLRRYQILSMCWVLFKRQSRLGPSNFFTRPAVVRIRWDRFVEVLD